MLILTLLLLYTREKNELEAKLRSLEAAVIAGGGSLSSQAAAGAASAEALAESARLSQQCAEQTELIHVLQHQLEDFQDLEEARAAFEEYQQHSTQVNHIIYPYKCYYFSFIRIDI